MLRPASVLSMAMCLCACNEDNDAKVGVPTPDQLIQRDTGRVPAAFEFPSPTRTLAGGECIQTTVFSIHPPLDTCVMGRQGEPTGHSGTIKGDCGLSVWYAFGDGQLGWETNLAVKDDWRIGDQVKVCRLDKPNTCPDGSPDPTAEYRATNLRTKTSWEAFNSLHAFCGPSDREMVTETYGTHFMLKLPKGLSKRQVFDKIYPYRLLRIRQSDYCLDGWCDPNATEILKEDFAFLARVDMWKVFFDGARAGTFNEYTLLFDDKGLVNVTYEGPCAAHT